MSEKMCCNCRYWQHRKCIVLDEIRNGYSICTCYSFEKRSER